MSVRDGGPAFPSDELHQAADTDVYQQFQGMTLRDYFAAKAMQAMVNSEFEMYAVEHKHPGGMGVGERWAQQAYQMADAMLAERAK